MATLSARTRVTVPDHVMTRVVGGSTVLLDVHSGRSFTLDAVGSRVWAHLEQTRSVHETLARLAAEFSAEPAQLEHDVLQLLDRLVEASLMSASAGLD